MKIQKFTAWVLMVLPFVATIFVLFFLPDQIPAHFNIHNQADRWGSKYELFLFPVLNLALGLFLMAMSKVVARHEADGTNNVRILFILADLVLGQFNLMTFYFLYVAYHQVENLGQTSFDLYQLLLGALGILFILLGNYMPKLRRNGLIGLRTPWSMKNDATWKKCQYFGGISFILAGALMVVSCFLTKGFRCLICGTFLLTVTILADIVYSIWTAGRN